MSNRKQYNNSFVNSARHDKINAGFIPRTISRTTSLPDPPKEGTSDFHKFIQRDFPNHFRSYPSPHSEPSSSFSIQDSVKPPPILNLYEKQSNKVSSQNQPYVALQQREREIPEGRQMLLDKAFTGHREDRNLSCWLIPMKLIPQVYVLSYSYAVPMLLALSLIFCMYQHQNNTRLMEEIEEIKRCCNCTFGTSKIVEETIIRNFVPYTEVLLQSITWKSALLGILVIFLPGLAVRRRTFMFLSSTKKSSHEGVSIQKRVAYLLDVLFSTYSCAKPVALLLAILLLIGCGGFFLCLAGNENLSGALWLAWTYVADSGAHANSVGFGQRIVSVIITIGGMLVFALMLGLVSDAISEKLDSLRKGKSEVIESNHTLILGWSDKLGTLLKQLAIANASQGGGIVVVLAEREKETMESDIAKLEWDLMGTKVICRSGSPLIVSDLNKVSASKARSIIVLAESQNAEQSDARALRVVLSLSAVRKGLRGHVVVELRDIKNEPVLHLVGGDHIETVVSHDIIGRLMVQCARQAGLAQIWEDILGFESAEFYLKGWPQLQGKMFKEVLLSFPDAIPCGVKEHASSKIVLNPSDDYVLKEGDEILLLAEDDNTYAPVDVVKFPEIHLSSLPENPEPPKYSEKILCCGWRRDMHDIIKVLDTFLPKGSELWLFSDISEEEQKKKLGQGNLDSWKHLQLHHCTGNPIVRLDLENLLQNHNFDSILIFADENLEENVTIADSRSLSTLLLIHDIQTTILQSSSRVGGIRRPSLRRRNSLADEAIDFSPQSVIITEILDLGTKDLVSLSRIGNYVLSNEFASMALATVSEDKQMNCILNELLADEGNELYVRPASMFVYDKEELSFYDIMARARRRGEIVIGYRKASEERAVLNPPKTVRQTWSICDVFIVIAREE